MFLNQIVVNIQFVFMLKYKDTHNIAIAGDLNGSLSSARNNNHDKLLKQFCRRHQLRHTITGYIKVEARKYSLDSINFIAM
jgi:hypothetical protein